ncbi:hypothetical protein CYLTODRAFT_412921, partial [Cylindrobasidium torrendii FP15055 ss-10]
KVGSKARIEEGKEKRVGACTGQHLGSRWRRRDCHDGGRREPAISAATPASEDLSLCLLVPRSTQTTNTVSWRNHVISNVTLLRQSGQVRVVFSTTEVYRGRPIAPPNPRLLKIHAAFSKVLHACGAAEVYDEWRDDTRKPGMVFDQTSLIYLNSLLQAIVV